MSWLMKDKNGKVRESIKMNRAEKLYVELYHGFNGGQTMRAIVDQIPDEFVDQLTAKQLALLMKTINTAYHKGKRDGRYDDI
jgi:hypothetical protein|nr:MAG TPA: hypothetical protein [Caudoviricetes sp.]DAU09609.1 MAG TPA: hypothetical protein [Caudoviricetes sp.]